MMLKNLKAAFRYAKTHGLQRTLERSLQELKGAPAAETRAVGGPSQSRPQQTAPRFVELPGELTFAELRRSGLFDAAWHLRHYPDVALSGLAPEDHFRAFGDALGRSPGPGFDAEAYLARYPDLRGRPIAALRHYIRFGIKEGRTITPVPATRPAPVPPGAPVAVRPSSVSERIARFPGEQRRPDAALRVLVCAHVAAGNRFGAERSFLDMVDGLGAIGAEVFAVVPKGTAPGYVADLRQRAAAVLVLPYGWWRADTPENEQVIADFAAIIAAEAITAVYANTVMLREPLSAARLMGIPGVIHVRELVSQDAALCERIGLGPDRIEAEVAARADLLIVNSACTGQAFAHLPQAKVALVYNTADFASLTQVPPRPQGDVLRVGMISSNLPKKGLDAVAALARTMAGDARVRFSLVGPENQHTAALAGHVRMLGYRDTPAEAVAELDVVLSLSDFTESFGRTVLEAQAAGRPAIVWDRGAPPEILLDGETGHVIPTGDLAAVARAITALADDPALYDRMARRAKDHARASFGEEIYKTQLRQAFDRVTANFAARPITLPARADMAPRAKAETRLAYFIWHFPVRSETFVLNELRLLRQMGHDVTVFCKQSPQPDFTPDFDIRWERVRDPDHLAQRLTETGRTMCHSHFVYPTVTEMLWPACEKAGIPFTFIPHAQDIFRHANDDKNRIAEIAASPLCKAVFVPSRFHKSYLEDRGVPASKMILNPNGCDVRRYDAGWVQGRAARPFRRISAIHRFTEKKGLIHLIRAAKALEADGITIAIHGYGEEEPAYREAIAQGNITNVEICGPVNGIDEMLAIFRTSDLFACPSVRAADGDMDGIPTVLMEAMAAGLPVLTSALSGIPDLVRHRVTGMVSAAEPEQIAAAIRAFYALPDVAVDGMIQAAARHVREDFNSEHLVDTLLRVWTNNRVDLLIVSWNGPAELREIIARLRRNTSMPHHLIVCDNGSKAETLALLLSVHAEMEQMTLILGRENLLVGPGTNACLRQGSGEYAIYVCGREGMTTGWGWERSFIETLRADPGLGLAGTIGYSPSYLRGKDYPAGVSTFGQFRNPGFALANPERLFGHVQGGFFGIRRAMVDQIGGFSLAVPHNHTDVEYSYYAESCGWKLGTVPGVMALYNKTRPALANRVDEHHLALHPPRLEELPMFDAIARAEVNHCNVCGQSCAKFVLTGDDAICPHCQGNRMARSLYRALAESMLLYRRLPALGLDLPAGLQPFWTQQFQGKIMTTEAFLKDRGGIADGRMEVVGLAGGLRKSEALAAASRVLAPGGSLLLAGVTPDAGLQDALRRCGLVLQQENRYTSRVLDFHPAPVLLCARAT